jgi:hypothetical protein
MRAIGGDAAPITRPARHICTSHHDKSPHVTSTQVTRQQTMESESPDHVIMRSLAQEIARGGDVALWAERSMVGTVVAYEWMEMPDFPKLVEKCRLEHSEKMVGKIGCCVERAINRLVELSENRRSLTVANAATNGIIKHWVGLSVNFVQEQQYQSLNERVQILQAAHKANKTMAFGAR